MGCSPQDQKELDTTEVTEHAHILEHFTFLTTSKQQWVLNPTVDHSLIQPFSPEGQSMMLCVTQAGPQWPLDWCFSRNEISSNLHVFEMCSLDECGQSCRKVFSYVLATAAIK